MLYLRGIRVLGLNRNGMQTAIAAALLMCVMSATWVLPHKELECQAISKLRPGQNRQHGQAHTAHAATVHSKPDLWAKWLPADLSRLIWAFRPKDWMGSGLVY